MQPASERKPLRTVSDDETGKSLSLTNSRFYRALGLLLVILVPGVLLLSRAVHLTGLGQLANSWMGACVLGACILYIRWRPLPKLIEPAQLALICMVLTNLLSVIVQIAGRSSYPLVDRQLAALDAAAHFHTADFVHTLAAWPVLRVGLVLAYLSIALLLVASVLVPPLLGHDAYAQRFILAVILGLAMTVLLFYRWPAVGPWVLEGYAPTPEQAAVAEYLARLRSNAPVLMDMNHAGIVSFPSFHVVLAILSAYALSCVRRLRWLVWTLCALICVSTITTGWHYGVDVIAGMAVSAVSIALAAWILPLRPMSPAGMDSRKHV